MSGRFPSDVAERVLSSQPLPIADAISALVAADSTFEQRDRVVEVFRATLRTLSALVLAARIQFGKGPGSESSQIPDLIRSLRSRGLTDGQWFAIVREMLRPWAQAPGSYPLGELVTLVHGKKAELPKLVDELLAMRKSETVAHGASGTKAALAAILERRVPQLAKLLALLEPMWTKARLVVPLARPEGDDEAQAAWLLMGDTPARGRWRRIDLAAGVRLAPGEALLVDAENRPLLALHPLVLVRRPSPEAIEEVFVLDGGTKKGAVYVALPSMAEHRESEAWGALSRALSDEDTPPENPEIGGVERPFRGLSSFGPEHAALFFGREEQTQALANRIRRHAFLTLTGPSGSGKTSLLRAGALPTLLDHEVALLRPGAQPLAHLAAKIAEATGHFVGATELLEKLRAEPSSLGAHLAQWSRQTPGPASAEPTSGAASPTSTGLANVYRIAGEPAAPKLAIIVDQAEEMLTLCHDESERAAFATALVSAAASPDGPSRVVLSVREDFFGRLATVGPLRGVYSQNVEVVTTPDRDALARTLYLPAKQFGYAFEDETLITTMVDTVASEPAALALLQFCADRLWEVRDRTWRRLTWDAYRALGGVEGALAAHADRVLAEMSPAQQKACRGLLLRLVTAERTRAVIARKELLESTASHGDAAAVLDQLIAGRLLTVGEADEGGDARVELVHEALIRHWGALARWLGEDVEGQRLTHALRQAAREWQARERARGLLWRDDALAELQRWRKRATDRLTAEEAAFVQASAADEKRGARIRRGLTAGAFVATGAFATFMFFQWRAAVEARVETEHQRAQAEIRGLVSEARNHEPAGRTGKALALLRAAAAIEDAEKATGATPVSVDMERLARAGASARVLAGHGAGVWRMALSPDGKSLATAALDGTAKLWDLATGSVRHTLAGGEGALRSIAYAPDGKTVATASGNAREDAGFVKLWDTASGVARHTIKLESTADHVAYSPDGKLLVSCAGKGGAELWNAESGAAITLLGETGQTATSAEFAADGKLVLIRAGKEARVHEVPSGALVTTFSAHEKPVLQAAFSHAGNLVATVSVDGTARLWEARTGTELARLAPAPSGYARPIELSSVAWSPDDKQLAVGAKDGSVRLVETASGAVRHVLLHAKLATEHVAFSPDGRRVLAASQDGSATVWDAETGALVELLRGHEEGLSAGLFLGNDRVVTGSEDRTARIWDIADGPFVRALTGHTLAVDRLVASRNGSVLVSVAADKTARVWDPEKGTSLAVLAGHKAQIAALALSSDGTTVVTGALDTTAKIWDARSGAVRATLEGHDRGATAVAISPDGTVVATAAINGLVRLWEASSGAEKKRLEGHSKKVVDLVFSSDGKRLASASWDGTARLWDVTADVTAAVTADVTAAGTAAGSEPRVLQGAEGWVSAVAFSPDGKLVAMATAEDARLHDAATGALLHKLAGHEQMVTSLAFSPDGSLLVTASLDHSLRTWRTATGAAVRTFTGHTDGAVDVAFSADGARIFSAGDTTARVWDTTTGLPLEAFEAHVTDKTPTSINAVLPLGLGDLIATASQDGSLLLYRSRKLDRKQALSATGATGNYQVCRSTLRVTPTLPFPAPDSVWAPEDACKE